VTHHLSELRLAGLVTLDISGQEKFYSTRFEALEAALEQLKEFIQKPSREGK
jgi:DNA-binding transcriptional ArsR family regulator